MGTASDPEEQRFDFLLGSEDPSDDTSAPASRPARKPPATRATGAAPPEHAQPDGQAAGLVRRVDELHAASVAKTSRSSRRRSAVVETMSAEEAEARRAVTREDEIVELADDPEMDVDDALTIAAFYDRVRRALAKEFDDDVWVVGEIRGLRESRGHRFFELADQGVETVGRGVAQQLEAVCWAREWPHIASALKEAGVDLEVGRVVRVRGRVSVWEGGSKLRFTINAIDVDALLGGIAAARHRLIQALIAEGLFEANRKLPLTLVPLRIGLVTSPGSEAHRDFVGQLERSGFAFEVKLEHSLVQGTEAPSQISSALGRLQAFAPDLAVVVRGGGARGDLAAFDAELVARAIATAPFPVWTGIGHTGDHSVADDVAHRALITPTACGEAVVAMVAQYWDQIVDQISVVAGLARMGLEAAGNGLHAATRALERGARYQLQRRSDELAGRRESATRAVRTRLANEQSDLANRSTALGRAQQRSIANEVQAIAHRRQVLRAYEPRRQLDRGWSMTRDNTGRIVRSVRGLTEGAEIVTVLADGEVHSTVQQVHVDEPVETSATDLDRSAHQ